MKIVCNEFSMVAFTVGHQKKIKNSAILIMIQRFGIKNGYSQQGNVAQRYELYNKGGTDWTSAQCDERGIN